YFGIANQSKKTLKKMWVNLSGYPGDNPCHLHDKGAASSVLFPIIEKNEKIFPDGYTGTFLGYVFVRDLLTAQQIT
ncbi:MAG: hypothetical protein AAFQ92_30270, partial [Bacteroidota bacterium]